MSFSLLKDLHGLAALLETRSRLRSNVGIPCLDVPPRQCLFVRFETSACRVDLRNDVF